MKWLACILPLLLVAARPIAFVARCQNNHNAANTNVTLSQCSGTQGGDIMLAWVVNFTGSSQGSNPAAPSGWTQVGSIVTTTAPDAMGLFRRVFNTGDSTPYTFDGTGGANTLGFPKVVMRVYRPVLQLDANNNASTNSGTSLAIPALTATAIPFETYVGLWAVSTANPLTLATGDLINTTLDQTQWSTGEGDKVISAAGSTPGSENATWTGANPGMAIAVTLESLSPGATTVP